MGYSNGYRALIPHFTSLQPIFTSQQPIFTVFVIKVANSKREKWDKNDKNDKKRLEIAKSILFHIHKHCTTSFTSLQPIFTSRQPIFTFKSSKFEAGKTATKWYKRGRFLPQCFNGVSQWLKSSFTPFYKQTTHFYKPTAHFHSFKCSKFKREK